MTIDDKFGFERVVHNMFVCLLDTNILSPRIPGLSIEDFFENFYMDIASMSTKPISNYLIYLTNLLNTINIGKNLTTTPEVLDEVQKLKCILRNRKKGLRKITNSRSFNKFSYSFGMKEKNKRIDDFREIGTSLLGIIDKLSEISKVLSRNKHYLGLFSEQGNLFNYNKYLELVSDIYHSRFTADKMISPADDGLVAASILLLQKLRQPIGIISHDQGIRDRLMSIDHYLEKNFRESIEYGEMHELLKYIGVTIFGKIPYVPLLSTKEIQRKPSRIIPKSSKVEPQALSTVY